MISQEVLDDFKHVKCVGNSYAEKLSLALSNAGEESFIGNEFLLKSSFLVLDLLLDLLLVHKVYHSCEVVLNLWVRLRSLPTE